MQYSYIQYSSPKVIHGPQLFVLICLPRKYPSLKFGRGSADIWRLRLFVGICTPDYTSKFVIWTTMCLSMFCMHICCLQISSPNLAGITFREGWREREEAEPTTFVVYSSASIVVLLSTKFILSLTVSGRITHKVGLSYVTRFPCRRRISDSRKE